MKAVRLHGAGDVRLHEEPAPEPRPGERRLRVTAVGICGSDLHWFRTAGIGDARLAEPLVLGHEFAAVTDTGERVAVEPAVPCGRCTLCLQGHPNLCPDVRFAGHGGIDGALREQMAWDESCLFPIPDSLSDEDGAMLEPLGVAIHTVDLAHLAVGMRVGVFGCGPIGLLVLQLARLAGAASVVASDRLPWRVDMAKAMGADVALLVEGLLESDHLRVTARGELDVVFEAAGEQDAVADAVAAVRPGGKLVLGGIPEDDKTSFAAGMARRKGLTVKWVRRMKHTYPRAIALVANGRVDVRSLVTHRFPLTRSAEAFAVAARREGLKVMIDV